MFIACRSIALIIGVCLDFIIGDPHWIYHPVRLIGKAAELAERLYRRAFPDTKNGNLAAGGCLVVAVALTAGLCAAAISAAAYRISPAVYIVSEALLCCSLTAAKSLKTESMEVYRRLEARDREGARKALSMIVGRDTDRLNESQIIRAAVETVAENTSDGVTAPIIYMLIGGSVLGYIYKAVNTLDSMVGYKNDKYLFFGRAAAKTDDALNFIPARISAALMILAAKICGYDAKNAARIYKRDRHNHPSPNSAHTEAVCAGALNIRLGGGAYYFGKFCEKKFIGDNTRPPENEDIKRANRLMYTTAAETIAAALILAAGVLIWR